MKCSVLFSHLCHNFFSLFLSRHKDIEGIFLFLSCQNLITVIECHFTPHSVDVAFKRFLVTTAFLGACTHLDFVFKIRVHKTVATVPARAIVGKDGCILHSAQQVATASTDELAQMRENLRRYNSGE